MKTAISVSRIVAILLIGAGCGAYWYAPILSLFDGVRELDIPQYWETRGFGHVATPHGFDISPERADFIYSSIFGKAPYWGESASRWMYCDGISYYVLGNNPEMPEGRGACSHYATLLGTRIHGKTGFVYQRMTKDWAGLGYHHITRDAFAKLVKPGNSQDDVWNSIGGIPFLTEYEDAMHSTTGAATILAHYWCVNGELVIAYTNDIVAEIQTNYFMGRM